MASITLRSTKGSALSFTEMDNNFSNLNTDKLENITSESIGSLSDVDTTGIVNNSILKYNSTSGNWEIGTDDAGSGGISNLVEDTTPQLGGNLDVNGFSITTVSNGNLTISADGTGNISITPATGNLTLGPLVFPSADGTTNQVLKTDGAGNLGFTTITSGIANVVEDTTPQLGGNLDGQGNKVENIELDDYKETIYTAGTTTGTITPDVANGNVQSITLTGNITFNAFSNPETGQSMTIIVKQPSSGGPYTLTSTMNFAGGTKTLSTAADAVDIISVLYDGTNYWASLSTNFS